MNRKFQQVPRPMPRRTPSCNEAVFTRDGHLVPWSSFVGQRGLPDCFLEILYGRVPFLEQPFGWSLHGDIAFRCAAATGSPLGQVVIAAAARFE